MKTLFVTFHGSVTLETVVVVDVVLAGNLRKIQHNYLRVETPEQSCQTKRI